MDSEAMYSDGSEYISLDDEELEAFTRKPIPPPKNTGTNGLDDCIYIPQAPTTSSSLKSSSPKHILIYLIPGNPGLIEYYRAFLTHLSATLDSEATNTVYHVIGLSLCQFELHRHYVKQPLRLPLQSVFDDNPIPFALRDQAWHVHLNLCATIDRVQSAKFQGDSSLMADESETARTPLSVILVGHSVGAYILMETIAWRQDAQKNARPLPVERDWEITGGICLFPTIVDLARSPRGRWLAPFAKLPFFARLMHPLVRLLCWFLPTWLLSTLVQHLAKQDPIAAAVTVAFLRSKFGVRQALHMARHELLEMTHDKWPDEVWDRSVPVTPTKNTSPEMLDELKIDRPHLYFYWGANDHWIDNSTRDKVIATRSGGPEDVALGNKPIMEIDRQGTPHDFCISPDHSRDVAGKVAEYVGKIMRSRA